MNPSTDFDRQLSAWLQSDGPGPLPQDIFRAALTDARTRGQRRRIGRTWQAPTLQRPRPVLTIFLAGLVVTTAVGGSMFLGAHPSPLPSVSPTPRTSATATASPRPTMSQPPADTAPPIGSAAFTPTGSLAVGRGDHTATLLADGRVLIIGGQGLTGQLASAEVWDPTTEAFSSAGSLDAARVGYTATLLADGRVLVVGGLVRSKHEEESLASAELWSPATDSFTPASGSLAGSREWHTATLLRDGRVLIVGGEGTDGIQDGAELWDPATASFSSAGTLTHAPGGGHSATLLPDGRVLIVGGNDQDGRTAEAHLWDPTTLSFHLAGSLAAARSGHEAMLLPDGHVLVAGGLVGPGAGNSTGGFDAAELWDASTESFSPVVAPVASGDGVDPRTYGYTMTLLPSGQVLVVGGLDVTGTPGHRFGQFSDSSDLWSPGDMSVTPGPALAFARDDHTATLLNDGRVLIVGGFGSKSVKVSAHGSAPEDLATAEIYH